LNNYLPTLPQISREALATLAGVVIAAWLLSQMPGLKAWVKEQNPF